MQMAVTTEASVILCSCPNLEVAQQLARELVTRGWSACVQILPAMTSIYIWQGKVCQENETLLVIKTASVNITIISEWLDASHPYEVPEVIAIPVTAGSATYINWLLSNSTGRDNEISQPER